MKLRSTCWSAAVLVAYCCVAAGAQDSGEPKFDVASIKPNHSENRNSVFRTQPGGRFVATNVTLRSLILDAFGVQDFQLADVPSWVTSDRFDVTAKAAMDPVGEQFQLMLQSLLADRFKLTVHRETKQQPIYFLVVAGSPGLRADGTLGLALRKSVVECVRLPDQPVPCTMNVVPGLIRARPIGLQEFAKALSSFVGRVVTDRTGLTGAFALDLRWSPEQSADAVRPSLFTALQEQLGLRLESAKGPVEVLVIDHVEPPTAD